MRLMGVKMSGKLNLVSMSDSFFNIIWELWDKGENHGDRVKKCLEYWEGKMDTAGLFNDVDARTPINICNQIVEAKLNNMLDAKFSLGVVPVLNSFAAPEQIKNMQMVADIYNDELHNVLSNNNWDKIKERSGRWGLICGFAPAQTYWDDSERVEGEAKIKDFEPNGLRWNKGVKNQEDLTWIGYNVDMSPYEVKKKYAVKDGNWDNDLCEKIDEITESQSSLLKGQKKGVVNIHSDQIDDQSFVYDSKGINAGKIVKLIVMFLLDDTIYAPDKKDDSEVSQEKTEYQRMYPNGRMLIFSANKEKKVILEDKPAPKGFKDLGNIDIFNPIDFKDLCGFTDLLNVIPIQDRINGAVLKIRQLIASHIKCLGLDKDQDMHLGENDFVNHAVRHLEGIGRSDAKLPQSISNDTLPDVAGMWEHIRNLIQEAYKVARINETMISGVQQRGTDSADQLEMLQESPMSSIRAIQRNFKNFTIKIGEKIICLIQENYTVQRIVRLSTGISIDIQGKSVTSKIARFTQKEDENYIELLDELGKAIQTIKIEKDWKFQVECVAGTELPRSRREMALFMDKLVANQMLGNMQDPDNLEMYLKGQDVPEYKNMINLIKRKQKEAAALPPAVPKIEHILADKDKSQAFNYVMEALKGYGLSQQTLLKAIGLIPDPNTLETAPVDDITSRSEVKQIASIAPNKISNDPKVAEMQNIAATQLEKLHKGVVQ
jgi:hypothetical protein